MAIRGENIGTAYVRILADGDGLRRGVREALDNEGVFDEFESSGRKTSAAWREGFEEEMAKKPSQSQLRDAIAGPLERGSWLNDTFFRGNSWRNFRSGMSKEFGEAGERAVQDLEDGLLRGDLDFDALNKRLENVLPLITKKRLEMTREAAQQEMDLRLQYDREFERRAADLHEQAMKEREDLDREFLSNHNRLAQEAYEKEIARQEMLNEAYRMNLQFDRQQRRLAAEADADFERHLRDRANAVERLREEYGHLLTATTRLERAERGISRRDVIQRIDTLRESMRQAGGATDEWELELRNLERRLVDIAPRSDRATRGIGRFADTVGRMTGRGSRNDFLNFFGSVNRNFVNLLSVVPRLVGGFAKLGGVFTEARTAAAAGGKNSLMSFLAGVGAAGARAGAGLAALAAGAVVLATMLGPAVALLSGLLGIVTALVSTIGFALVGAVGAVGGLLVTMGAAAGVAALAFYDLDKAQERVLKRNFRPVIDQFGELADIAQSRMFRDLGGLGDNIAAGLERLEPTVRKTADSIRGIGISFGESLQSPGYRKFVDALENFLPNATTQLGNIIGNTLGGFGGLFRGMIPFLERTLTWLEDITTRFNEWANSAKGQNQIKQFFEDAGDSAESLGEFLGAVWDLLTDILDAGRGTGDSIFDSMTRNIEEFTQYLRDNPEALEDWFGNARDLASDLGELVTTLGALVDKLDSEESRKAVRFLINIGDAMGKIAQYVPNIEAMTGALSDLFDGFGGKNASGGDKIVAVLSSIGRFAQFSIPPLGALRTAISEVWNKLKESDFVQGVLDRVRQLPGRIRGIIEGIPRIFGTAFGGISGRVAGVVNSVVGFFRRLPQQVGRAVGPVVGRFRGAISAIPGIAGSIVNSVRGFFASLPGRIRSAISSIPARVRGVISGLPGIAQSSINGVVRFFQQAPGRVRGAVASIPGIFRGIISGLPGIAQGIINRVAGFFTTLPGRIRGTLASIPGAVRGAFDAAADAVASVPGRIVDFFSGLGSRISSAIGSINIPRPNIPDIPGLPPPFARGGLVLSRTYGLIGEEGPEAVVPLDRPLNQVDPAVRWLSAIAQGKAAIPTPSGRTIEVGGITVISPNDPHAVAKETVNALVATGF